MKNGKYSINVVIADGSIAVSCEHGEYINSPISNAWLWVLGAIAFADEHTITINDVREHRQEHQRDMTCNSEPDSTDEPAVKKCEETGMTYKALPCGNHTKGTVDGYTFSIKHFENKSIHGIDEGKISKLDIRKDGVILANFDRGWDIEPADEVKVAYTKIITKFN